MARPIGWRMSPGETLVLAKSLAGDLEDDALLTGTPEVTAWTRDSNGSYNAAEGFTVTEGQINSAELATVTSETIAVRKGVVFELEVEEDVTPGHYFVRVECDADDGTHPVAWVPLTIEGPPPAAE